MLAAAGCHQLVVAFSHFSQRHNALSPITNLANNDSNNNKSNKNNEWLEIDDYAKVWSVIVAAPSFCKLAAPAPAPTAGSVTAPPAPTAISECLVNFYA
ncbi:unnamed protein product [Ceratitis capitata]|uniref:(Mediterranean fruit fly) hypothetical protein n=1 Tax=Ceratitis capitata TaxID=7213 RepID=A0A811VEM4_CERCA|nr:unnamed protein product [Ceratitis capitata]